MKFQPVTPLSPAGRAVRAIVLVLLLIGSLFPDLGGIGVAAVATVAAVPLIVYELLRWIPKIHAAIPFVGVLFGAFAAHMWMVPPLFDYGAEKSFKWVTITLLTALAACLLRDMESIVTFAKVWIGASVVLAVVATLGFDGGRADAFDSNPIWLGRAMGTGLVMVLWFRTRRQLRMSWTIVLCIVLVIGIIAAGSRGPVLAVGVGAIVLALFSTRYRTRKVLGIAAVALGTYWAISTLPFFADTRFANITDLATDEARNLLWAVTPPVIMDNPWGVGVGNWRLHVGLPRYRYPHNLLLEVFSEFGWMLGVGLIAVLVAVCVALVRAGRVHAPATLVLACLLAELANSSVSGDMNGRTLWFLVTLGFLMGVGSVLSAAHEPERRGTVRRPLPPSSCARTS